MGFLDRLKNALPSKSDSDVAADAPQEPPDDSDWISSGEWRSWDPPLDIVSGESHYQPALQKVAGPPRHGGWLVACEAELRREPDNSYDPDAVAVVIAGSKVGYINADACGDIATAMDRFGKSARANGIPALVRGGWTDRPSLGVMLWLNHEEVRRSISGVDWNELIEDYACGSWPPRGSESGREPGTRTGQERSHHAGAGFSGEPRMPPLTEHYSDYVEDVKELKRRKDDARAETLLLALIDADEAESRAQGLGVAPWYYEQLAIVRRKRGDLAGEVAILERYAAMPRAPGASSEKVLARLEDARARQAKGR
jgi:hypothetical protein